MNILDNKLYDITEYHETEARTRIKEGETPKPPKREGVEEEEVPRFLHQALKHWLWLNLDERSVWFICEKCSIILSLGRTRVVCGNCGAVYEVSYPAELLLTQQKHPEWFK